MCCPHCTTHPRGAITFPRPLWSPLKPFTTYQREQPDSKPLGWFLFTLGIKLKFLNPAQRPRVLALALFHLVPICSLAQYVPILLACSVLFGLAEQLPASRPLDLLFFSFWKTLPSLFAWLTPVLHISAEVPLFQTLPGPSSSRGVGPPILCTCTVLHSVYFNSDYVTCGLFV